MPPPPPALVLLAAAAAVLAGCPGPPPAPGPGEPLGPAVLPLQPLPHPLAQAGEPVDLLAPTFALLGAVARAGPGAAMGEPGLWAHADGTLYLTFAGCERAATPLDPEPCVHGPLFRSADGGATWSRLNRGPGSHLSAERATFGNRDADVAVDGLGRVYAAALGRGVHLLRSDDAGASWAHLGDLAAGARLADRPWVAAAGAGRVAAVWLGEPEGGGRAVLARGSADGGASWAPASSLGRDVGWVGQVHFDPPGARAFAAFTERVRGAGPTLAALDPLLYGTGPAAYRLMVARSLDGGAAWDAVDTGVEVVRSGTGRHWPGTLMAPSVDVTGDGHVVVAWSEEVRDPTGQAGTGARVRAVASADGGATWGPPVALSDRAAAIMPWVTGGAGDRYAVAYYASDVPLDTDQVGDWDVAVVVVDGAGAAEPRLARAVVEAGVHQGGICARGGEVCRQGASDRSLLDYFEADLLPDGRLMVAYAADPAGNAEGPRRLEVRVAAQDGGTPLRLR